MSNPRSAEFTKVNSRLDFNTICGVIHRAIPETVKDGRFIIESDLSSSSDTIAPISSAPPSGFIPKMDLPRIKPPRLSLPSLNVPKLKHLHGHLKTPRVGTPMLLIPWKHDEESSAEKMERFKKGVQKMLNFVKVIGKIDKYISERTRIVIDKLSKTFAE
ncbi:unnamed protein product [Danaus chrysippus]|uniref:(African queen) hypothetical protein n=1 Tax=Danaus chrysippus TaxID=151541 RepID=A0A8J2QC21_9NEOP|nr:unnamed protein product [Danaus chrysippus]